MFNSPFEMQFQLTFLFSADTEWLFASYQIYYIFPLCLVFLSLSLYSLTIHFIIFYHLTYIHLSLILYTSCNVLHLWSLFISFFSFFQFHFTLFHLSDFPTICYSNTMWRDERCKILLFSIMKLWNDPSYYHVLVYSCWLLCIKWKYMYLKYNISWSILGLFGSW